MNTTQVEGGNGNLALGSLFWEKTHEKRQYVVE